MNRREFLAAAAGTLAAPVTAAPPRPPNVILMLCDDLGNGDVGFNGSALRTPNLDRIAAEGVHFTQCYSGDPVCSPSRAALMTGRYPTRTGVPRVLFPYDKTGLNEDETTIAQALKQRNYKTMCVGKWHLGHLPHYLPTSRGFDEYFGIPYSNDMDPPVLLHNTEIVEARADMNTLTQKYTERAVKFIESANDSPFFLYFAHSMPHIPLGVSERFRHTSNAGLYGDVVSEIDWSAGEVLAALKRIGAEKNTLFLFSSDNGPWYQGSPGRLRGRKGTTYEGGMRVPFLGWMPGRIPAGRVSHGLASLMDVFPTVARLTGAPLPQKPLDGIDIWPLLTGKTDSIEREALLYFDDVDVQCARRGRWKLHIARHNSAVYSPAPPGGRHNYPLSAPELYDIENDADESYDVAPEHPEVVRDMQARIDRLIATFPEEIRRSYAATRARQVRPNAVGQYAVPE